MQEHDQQEEVLEEDPANPVHSGESEGGEGDAGQQPEPGEVLTPEAEAAKWREAAIRSAADLDNYRKRMARERAEDLRFARAGLIEELLPVFDNFAMGLQMAGQEKDSMIYKGMEMVQGQMADFLEAQGVKEVSTEGPFDPNFHEAVAEEEKEGAAEGEILYVKRRGYLLHDRLLRAAAVVVAKALEADSNHNQAKEGGE